jgi:hypothetical protein
VINRRWVAALVIAAIAISGCGGSRGARAGGRDGQRRDEFGHLIAAGEDWARAGTRAPKSGEETSRGSTATKQGKTRDCGNPTAPPAPSGIPKFPGYDYENPFGKPDNDFQMKFEVSPAKGDPLTVVSMEVTAVGVPRAHVVIFAHFYDGDHHGLRAAKIADLTGRAVFKGPIPKNAPVGVATIAASASTANGERSALATEKFIVTGPGCR